MTEMPDLTNDQLSALAQTAALNHEIESELGREMTVEERAVVDRARVEWRLRRSVNVALSALPIGRRGINPHTPK
jgi:hypothetical protein